MGHIIKRLRKNGTPTFTAQIRKILNGHKYSEAKSFSNEKSAQKWLDRREKEITDKPPSPKSNPTIGEVLGWYVDDFAPTGRTKVDHINFLIRHPISLFDAVALTPAQLIKHARSRTSSPATIANDFVWLRIAFRAVRLSRSVDVNLQSIEDAMFILRKEKIIGKSKQRDRRPSLDELNRLLEYFDDRDGRALLPMVEIVLFAIFSGRRQEEITLLQRADRNQSQILVREMKHPREKKDTWCGLTEQAEAILDRQPKNNKFYFPYNSKSVSAAFTRGCHMVGIEDLHFHDLRRECASWLFEQGCDIPRVAKVTGHKAWTSLQRYTHLQDQKKFDKYKNWEWLP